MSDQENYIDPNKAVENTDYLKTVFAEMNTRFGEELDLAQGRSNFQIEKFVAYNEFTIASTYKHVLKNAQIMRKELFRTIKEGIEHQREFELKWNKVTDKTQAIEWKTKDGGVKYCWHDLDEFDYKVYMNDLAIGIKDKVTQLAFFDQILTSLTTKNGKAITKEQFDAEEPIYWQRRLTKQASTDILSQVTGLHGGNLDSIIQAAAPVLIPGSNNQVTNFPPMELLIPNTPDYNPGKFLEQAKNNMVNNYLEVSKDFSDAIAIENQSAPTQSIEDNAKDRFVQPVPTTSDTDLLKSLGIGETTK